MSPRPGAAMNTDFWDRHVRRAATSASLLLRGHLMGAMAAARLLWLAVILLSFTHRGRTDSESSPGAKSRDPEECARSCAEESCDGIGIRYGKYCGVGWGGCPGEEPCDDLDKCCRSHDKCAMKRGVQSVECHKNFKRCMVKVQNSGKEGFSKRCPYSLVIPTMTQGMDLAIMMSQFATGVVD